MEGVSSRDFLVKALMNNTFSLRDVEHNLDVIVRKCYRELSTDQKNRVGLNRFNFTSDDIKMEDDYRYRLTLGIDLIEATCRKDFHTSDYFYAEYSIQEMYDKPEIFDKVPLLFIDGHLTFDYLVYACRDKTDIILGRNDEMLRGHDFTVIFVHLNGIATGEFNQYIIDKYPDGIPYGAVFNTTSLYGNTEGNIVGVISIEDTTTYSSFFDVVDDGGKFILNMSTYHKNLIKKQRSSTILLLNISYLNFKEETISCRFNHIGKLLPELAVIEQRNTVVYENPIPVENVIVQKRNSDGEYVFYNHADVKLHYPNIYVIVDKNMDDSNQYKLTFFYVPIEKGAPYTNKLDVLYFLLRKKYPTIRFEQVLNNIYFSDKSGEKYYKFFDQYFSFADHQYLYSISDFRANMLPNHFDYKVAKMWEFLRAYPEHLREYLLTQYKIGRNYFLEVSDIDLTIRERMDDGPEHPLGTISKRFDELCYVFAFRNDSVDFLDICIYLDGKLTTPIHSIIISGMQYMYIPARLVRPDSYIEIEKFQDFFFEERMNLTLADAGKEMEIYVRGVHSENYVPTIQDMYFVDEATGSILNPDAFKVEIEVDGDYEEIINTTYCYLTKVRVSLRTAEYEGKDIIVKVGKDTNIINYTVNDTGIFTTRLTKTNFNVSKDYVRVYHNGRLLPSSLWTFTQVTPNSVPSINVKYFLTRGDNITVVITPFRNREFYSLSRVPKDGTIDLEGHINKPFDLAFFDAYLNGVKLNKHQVKYITPTKIRLSGVHSLSNFVIYEKDRDEEYFYLDYTQQKKTIEDIIIEDIDDLTPEDIEDVIIYIIGGCEINEDIEPEIDPGVHVTPSDFDLLAFYSDELSKVKHLNPDYYQFFDYDVIGYPEVYNNMVKDGTTSENNTLQLNPDFNPDAPIILRVGSPELYN